MHAKKSLTASLRLPPDANNQIAPTLPAAFGKALGSTPQPGSHPLASPGRPGKTDTTARSAKPGVHVTKPEVPRSGHR